MKVYASTDQRMPLAGIGAHARRAEALGYSGLQIPEAVHDCFLAALLALEHTRTLRVVTSVALAFPRSPMSIAYAAWDLQQISHGRFALGLGTQVKGNIEGRFSVSWTPPIPRMREYILSLRAIWEAWQSGGPLHFEGEQYRFTRMQPFFRPDPLETPGIPILLGGVNRRITELAGELADGMLTHPTNSIPRYLREVTLPALEVGAERAGRAPSSIELTASGFVATARTSEGVERERERIREYLTFLYSTSQYWPTLDHLGWGELGRDLQKRAREGAWAEMSNLISDELLDLIVPSGTYEDIPAILREWFEGLAPAITFPMPADPADDPQARDVVEILKSS